MKIYGIENIKYDSEKLVAEWLESYNSDKAKHKFDFAIASKEFVIASEEDIEIDFILVGNAGVFALEVKGGNVSINNGVWQSNSHELKEDPFKQARKHFYGLWELISSNTSVKNTVGYYAVAFPGIRVNKPLDAAYPMAMYFDSRFGQAPECFIDGVIELSHQKHGAKTLNNSKVQEIKELLVPNYTDYITDLTASDDEKILKLSDEQLVALEGLEDVKRMIIEGPPGSGKTILAIEQALINEKNKIKTLFVCHNRTLANKLKAVLDSRIGHAPEYVTFETLSYVKSNIQEKDFEYLIADEAQDYLNDEDITILDDKMLGGLDKCKFRIFLGLGQNLFNKIDHEFLLEHINRDDVVFYRLKYNYRNTKNIIFISELFTDKYAGKAKDNPNGEMPNFFPISYFEDNKNVDWHEYCKNISNKVNELLEQGYKPEDILMVTSMKMGNSVFRNIENIKIRNGIKLIHCKDVNWDNINKNEIVYGSVYEVKGMDSRVAISLDNFRYSEEDQALVALTRARSKLLFFYGKHYKEFLENKLKKYIQNN